MFAAIWGGDNEQCVVPFGVLGLSLCKGIDMGLLFRSVGYCDSLHCDGSLCQLPHQLPSLDSYNGHPTLSLFSGFGLCS